MTMTRARGLHASGFRPAVRVASIGVSEILQIGARAAAMKRAGAPVIVLGAGEPDFDTPAHVKQAAWEAMQQGRTKYTDLGGTPELKSAIRDKFRRENSLLFESNEVIAATGGKQILFNAMMATLDPGDQVIIPAPYWTTYIDIVRICNGEPVTVPTDPNSGFRLEPWQLEAAITPRTRWLLLNSPSNPSGSAYLEEHYRGLLQVLSRHPNVWLMVDDMYEHIRYGGGSFVTPAQLDPSVKSRTLTVNGVSKAYAMTGWRIGYAGGPSDLVGAMATVQSQSTSCPSSISQAAAVAALTGPQDFLVERQRQFQSRRDMVIDLLNAIDGIRCGVPEGAFYVFPTCVGLLGRRTPDGHQINSDTDFCAYLLSEAQVAVVPGKAFGLSPFFRISYATSESELREALRRIAIACERLSI